MDPLRDPAFEVIHDAPSRIASISSVAKEGLGLSSIWLAGGQGSLTSLMALRFFLIMKRVRIKHPNAIVLRAAMLIE